MHHIRRVALRTLQARITQTSARSFASRVRATTKPHGQAVISWSTRRHYSEEKKDDVSAATEQKTDDKTEEQTIGSAMEDAAEAVKSAVSAAVNTASSAVESVVGESNQSQRSVFPDAGKGRVLYVGNLYFDLGPEVLRETFEAVGKVVNAKVVTDSTGMSKGFGYVEFEHAQDAEDAIRQFDQYELQGRRMTVQFHVRKNRTASVNTETRNPPSRTLFIGNLSFDMSDNDMNDLFGSVKGIKDVRIAVDRKTGQPRGFAHADFIDLESAQVAKDVLKGKIVHGRHLRIDYGLPSTVTRTNKGGY